MANEGLIIDMDWDISKAEAKQRKLNRMMDESQRKADLISKKIGDLNKELSSEERLQSEIKDKIREQVNEAARLEDKIAKVKNGTATIGETIELGGLDAAERKLSEMEESIKDNYAELDKSLARHKKISNEIGKQNLSLKTQNNKTADIGDQILLNGKKQSKFSKAFEKSTKSADRFGKRLKSLIASALFFSLVTKAFTALRNEFGKLITETGTKTASLVAKLNNNLAVIGRTLYEYMRPAIEWLLEKIVHITYIIANALAKALGKNIKKMREMAEETQKTEKALASFDTLQKIDTTENKETPSASIDTNSDSFKKTKELLEQILPLVLLIGSLLVIWNISRFLSQLGVIPGSILKIIAGVLLVAAGFALLFSAAVNWDDSLQDGENTLNAIIGTIGTILVIVGLIALGVAAWPVLIIGAFVILGMWLDNYKNKVDEWLNSLPFGIYELCDIICIAARGVWRFIKNLFKGLFEIFTGEPEKGFKRIGIALVNLLIDALNIVIQALNFLFLPVREIILKIGRALGKDWNIKDVAVPKINHIPQLATGAVLPGGSPMLAWVNDQPKGQPYVEGSIENIAAAFEKYLGDKSFGNQNITIEAKGNWAQFIKWMNLQIKQENKRASIWG